MDDCIFCKIVQGTIPAYTVYEDAHYMAFLDIFPRVKGHTLLIPKKHYRWVYDVPEFGEYWEIARKVANSVQKKTKSSFTSFITMGEEVPHAHIHILPQRTNTSAGITFAKVIPMSKQELLQLAEDIKNN